MGRLTMVERERAVGMLQAGMNCATIARQMAVSKSTLTRLAQRLQTTGHIRDRPRSGRPRETTPAQDRHMRVLHLRNRFQLCRETAVTVQGLHNISVSRETVRRRLKDAGIRARRPVIGLPLTLPRRAVRLQWARQHRGWRAPQWNSAFDIVHVPPVRCSCPSARWAHAILDFALR